MSISDNSAPPATAPAKTTTAWIPTSAEDVEDLRALDNAWERVRKNVPDAPYILAVPCAEPRYHHWSRESAESWCRGTTFDPNEERLQYMSFVYRDHADSCFVCRTEVDEERDRRAAMKAKGIPSGVSTPVRNDVPKKKISLAAYRDKQAGLGTPSKQAPAREAGKKEDTPAKETHKLPAKPPVLGKSPEPQSHKRAHEEAEEKHSAPKARDRPDQHTKKPRMSDSSTERPMVNTSTSTPHGLPPLVSPISSPTGLTLPPLLSPTLPDVVEVELKKREEEQKHNRAGSNASSSSDQKASATTPPHTKTHQAETATKGMPQVAGKRPAPQKPPEHETKSGKRPPDTASKSVKTAAESPVAKTKAASDKHRKLIIKLRYGRKRRQEVERLLRLPPSRKVLSKEHDVTTESSKDTERPKKAENPSKAKDTAGKEAPRKLAPPAIIDGKDKSKHVAEKRPRAAEDQHNETPPTKRPRAPSTVDAEKKPRTPTQRELQSPALSTKSSSQKQQYLTPSRNLKSSSMIRSVSNESNGITVTPGQSAGTPVVSGSFDTSSIAASTPSNGKGSSIAIWQEASRKWNPLGRKLKHGLQALMGSKPSLKERKRAAAMGMDCLLTYIAAYTCQDYMYHLRGMPGDIDGNWRTILPLHRYMSRICAEFPHLDALRLQLGAVICTRITAIIAHHGPVSNAPEKEREKDKESSGSDTKQSNTLHSLETSSRTMGECQTDMVRFVADARLKLPVEDLIAGYPATWSGRAKGDELRDVMAAGPWEALAPGTLDGAYILPVAVDMTPVQALRMGAAFVREWITKEGVEYELQLKL
ncbi:uncharacterized protein K452DRAFT_294588 [Aplosporella prunicola CBS 121167]|uniref:Uncharacterized protein n=1 Tax=Aplosporella prunicola CBS 121167 TaxID=1176127 RepID=A0A6A6BPA9_9PEZI|nr:uncharacterized protein K452DRAFT_294588 [Aplosporella prunicola CBS 121167]KAF2145969.1 hypothetical protein K452DRAFT_294588 [Aplosporella prunicola CBS 121167]